MPRKRNIRTIDRIAREFGLNRAQRRLLHQEISGAQLSVAEIRSRAREIRRLYPRK